ncbi:MULTISPECIES: hypothetical protein [Streptomyces]|uniref:Integral membrane protein n=2 Tax=Streptomyces TaxID=1883 RepID=A0ABS4V4W6_9ACTN|nr:hypothetical protein [Streptomyces clavifer]
MSTPMSAEQAWRDLQRIRVPQERVYDEVERSASGGRRAAYATAAIMWVFLAGLGLDLPRWGVWLMVAAYLVLLSVPAVHHHRRSQVLLHHSHCTWRMFATFAAGAVVTGGTALLSGRLTESLAPMTAGLIQATASATAFLLFVGPASRWAVGSLRRPGARTYRAGADR